ncbi:hypothetical protein C8Q75DRAFT_747281 [Abortiporus biennis]|nr:hypothetical protein C8Q75DRAFT_747281 [Abortiporus biennis]
MSSDNEDILAHFSSLDELIQLIYQGSHKFVVLSAVDEMSWTIHLGLTGSQNRWWKGQWTEKDIQKFVGHKASSFLLESFAEKLKSTFVQGELFVGNWSADEGADINLTFGPTAKTPIHIPLQEMSSRDTSEFTWKVFLELALQSQSKGCRIYPSSLESSSISPVPTTRHEPPATIAHKRKAEEEPQAHHSHHDRHDAKSSSAKSIHKKPSSAELALQAQETKIKELEHKLAHLKEEEKAKQKAESSTQAKNSSDGLASRAKTNSGLKTKMKGASLANPNKKARKYQALEFESDDD